MKKIQQINLNGNNRDDLNLDENTATAALSEETRTKLEEFQNELDRLNNEKANIDAQLSQMSNPMLRVKILFLLILFNKYIIFFIESFINKN